jgi:hypothetical protein
MKRAMFSLLAVVILAGLTGCVTQHGRRPWFRTGDSCAQATENCQSCGDESCGDPRGTCRDPGGCRECGGRGCRLCQREQAAAGPATGAVTYPYYTTRGPRDFLAKNPPSIGP